MYCIHQIADDKESIIDIIDSEDYFFRIVLQLVDTIFIGDYHIVENIVPEDLNKDNYAEKNYLINNSNEIFFIKKEILINLGYIYNTETTNIKTLFTWKLIKVNDKLADEIRYETLDVNKSKNTELTISEICEQTKNFDYDEMVEYPCILAIMKRNIKHNFILNIVPKLNPFNNYDFYQNSLVISPTEKMNQFYSENFPGINIIYEYDDDAVAEYLNKQKGCIIFDDCFRSKETCHTNLKEAIMNGRHYKTPVLVINQTSYSRFLTPDIRMNFDYLFFNRDEYAIELKNLWNRYFPIFPTFKIFKAIFLKLTMDNRIVVLNNHISSSDLSEKIYTSKLFNYSS